MVYKGDVSEPDECKSFVYSFCENNNMEYNRRSFLKTVKNILDLKSGTLFSENRESIFCFDLQKGETGITI